MLGQGPPHADGVDAGEVSEVGGQRADGIGGRGQVPPRPPPAPGDQPILGQTGQQPRPHRAPVGHAEDARIARGGGDQDLCGGHALGRHQLHLQRIVARNVGVSPPGWLEDQRLIAAQDLLCR